MSRLNIDLNYLIWYNIVWKKSVSVTEVLKEADMKKLCLLLVALAYGVPLLAGCSAVGDRDLSVTTVYFITAVASLLLLVSFPELRGCLCQHFF